MPESLVRVGDTHPGAVLQLAECEYIVVVGLSEDRHHIIAYPVYVVYSDKGGVRVEGIHTGTRSQMLDIETEVSYIGILRELAPHLISVLGQLS
ncbi:MAG: hypothetical protein A2804_02335 [Candidatus Pacebacteria bacterium RIFCSPHIGHO2_01_FULL_46_10]|nr:MAG: hypothetical protein A2804_02335 [Candidatus Pacebacteria bacterium RIFCSPHIGHO2_01_FULL_46_10]